MGVSRTLQQHEFYLYNVIDNRYYHLPLITKDIQLIAQNNVKLPNTIPEQSIISVCHSSLYTSQRTTSTF